MRITIARTVTILVGLAVVYAALLVAAFNIANPFAQLALVSTGSAILGAGLVFFMPRISASAERLG